MDVYINDEFWNERLKTTAENTLPSMYNQLVETGRWGFFDFNWKHIKDIQPHIFWDSDIAKFLEAVCFAMKYTSKSEPIYKTYEKWASDIIYMAKKAQRPDGYLNTFLTQLHPDQILTNIMEKHELYCCGHLLEAAVAYFEATGSMEFVKIMRDYVDLLCEKFGPAEGQLHGYPGHEEIELALLKLYKLDPKEKYLNLLEYFVEQRGYNDGEFFDEEQKLLGRDPSTFIPPDGDGDPMWPASRSYWYYQAKEPVRTVKEVEGHAVRQVYFLTGVQGLANIKKDVGLKQAVRRLFDNMIDKKFYIHGGIGSVDRWEGFGKNYDLPWIGYSETCASIGLVFMCEKMLYDKLDRKVALAMERALYNDVLGGVSIKGDSYYYDQHLTGEKGLKRKTWFLCSCCPPNVARLFNSLEKYSLLHKPDSIDVHLYIGAEVHTTDVSFKLTSHYPFEGLLEFSVKSSKAIKISIREPTTQYKILFPEYSVAGGYITIAPRVWEDETFKIEFDIPVEVVTPNPNVAANVGHLAVQRGPFVYALQKSGLQNDVDLDTIEIMPDQQFKQVSKKYLETKYTALTTEASGQLLEFVPYFVTGNETPGEDFRIWIKDATL